MKAWVVTDKHENTLNIYHAETRGKLIQEVCNEHGLSWEEFFDSFTFKRCQLFDDREVTNLTLAQSGLVAWTFCDYCNNETYVDDEETVMTETHIFCSKECQESHR